MFPLIRSGDCLHVVPAERYRPGDILLYERGGDWCAHRLIRIDSGAGLLTLQGDAQAAPDPLVLAEAVMGRVVAVERSGTSIPLDGYRGRLWNLILRLPLMRYPLLPWTWLLLARLFRPIRRMWRKTYLASAPHKVCRF
jgi:hypothetical protein